MMNLWFAGSEVIDSHGSPAIVKPPTNFRKISVKIYSCDFFFAGDIIGAKSEGSLMHELAKYIILTKKHSFLPFLSPAPSKLPVQILGVRLLLLYLLIQKG